VATGSGLTGVAASLSAISTGAVTATAGLSALVGGLGWVAYKTWMVKEAKDAVLEEIEQNRKYRYPSIDALYSSLSETYNMETGRGRGRCGKTIEEASGYKIGRFTPSWDLFRGRGCCKYKSCKDQFLCRPELFRIDLDSNKTQGLQTGDIVCRQYAERERSVYTLMAVLETGVETVGDKDVPYFVGALLDGDEPKRGELLDLVRITNLFDRARSGAMYLTASDDEAPYMDVIDGMATERSLCYPEMAGGIVQIPDKSKYAVSGDCLAVDYRAADAEASRIIRLTQTVQASSNTLFGLKQTLEENVEHPERLLVSFKVRASKELADVPI